MISILRLTLICTVLTVSGLEAVAQPAPVLTWIPGSSTKLEQIIGDQDWANGSNTTSQTITRFHILANGEGYSFEDQGKLIFLFGDTVSDNTHLWQYAAADPLAWSTNTEPESGLLLNFFTNRPYAATNFTPVFVQPAGISMAGDDVPCAGISLSNGVFLVCTTGSDPSDPSAPGANGYSVLTTFYESNLLAAGNTYAVSNFFVTNRTLSACSTNYPMKSALQGHFIIVSMHEFGTNVLIYGTGEYRAGDIFLSMTPTANFASGAGTLYFAGLTNDNQPVWSIAESNCVPVVQDNPTNGPAWPNDFGTVGNVSVIYATNLNLWLMTYDGGRSADTFKNHTTGIYFSYASQPWGPWSTPQLIYNKYRDGGDGVFIFDVRNQTGPAGPTIDPENHSPTNTDGTTFAPNMIERFTRITNATLNIYYTMSTWNPYTVVKMRSSFTITPTIDPASLGYDADKGFKFSWAAPTNEIFHVEYSDVLSATNWVTFTNIITSTDGIFHFADRGVLSGGLGGNKYYRVSTPQ